MTGAARFEDWSPEKVQAGLADGSIVLVDVREPSEFASERIEGAINHPLSAFDASALPIQGPARVVLHCIVGRRSLTALEMADAAGAQGVDAHLGGGLIAWKNAGLPTVSGPPA